MKVACFVALPLLATAATAANLTLVKEYSGSTFFDEWDFYGDSNLDANGNPWNAINPWDDYTEGDVFYMGKSNGSSLYHVDNTTGHAFIKVDNTTFVEVDQKRKSIRMTSQAFFNVGTLWVIDAFHLPWGCSVWPSLWTKGANWPATGEIDIIEGVNRMTFNQMTLHTAGACTVPNSTNQTGTALSLDCSTGGAAGGCPVTETKANSYGPDFESHGGGVWAAMFDVSGISIWFWSRTDIPASITTANDSIDVSSWGTPSAAWPTSAGCDIASTFGPQQLVLDITLCGVWAGNNVSYAQTCNSTPQPTIQGYSRCYQDNVIFNGTSDYATAYFELASIRAFALDASNATTTAPAGTTATFSQSASGSPTSAASGPITSSNTSGDQPTVSLQMVKFVAVLTILGWTVLG